MKTLSTILCMLFVLSLYTQEIVHTRHYAIEEGLENRVVRSITRSQTGLFYILGQNGLQVFDGRSIHQDLIAYPSDLDMVGSRIHTIGNDELIIISAEGDQVYSLDKANEKFTRLELPDLVFAKVVEGDLLFLTIVGKLYKWDASKDSKTIQLSDNLKGFLDFWNVDQLVLGIDSIGVLHLLEAGKNRKVDLPFKVQRIEGAIANTLWLETDRGVFTYDVDSDSFQQYDEYTRVVLRHDQKGNTLVGLSSNPQRLREMFLFKEKERVVFHQLLDFNDTVIDFFSEDYTKHVLLCTYNGLIHHRVSELIYPYHKYEGKREGTFGNLVSCLFYRDKDSSVYLLREVTGIMKFDGQKVDQIHSEREQMLMNGRKFVHYDQDKDALYLAVHDEGFYTMQRYDFESGQLSFQEVDVGPNCLRKYNDSIFIIGGHNKKPYSNNEGAIFLWDTKNDSVIYRQTFLVPPIFDISYHKGDLYLGTYEGLYVIKDFDYRKNPRELQLSIIDQSENNYFYIDTLQNGQLVASKTGDGLAFIENYQITKVISTEDGLCDNSIASIKYDEKNHAYWIGTFNGIAIMDSNHTIINTFLYKDGMPSSETNRFANTEDKHGNLYFGTINGFAKFNPSKLIKDDHLEKYEPILARYYQASAAYQIPFDSDNIRRIPYEVDEVEIIYQTRDYLTDDRYQRWQYFDIKSTRPNDTFNVAHGKITAYLSGNGVREVTVYKKGDQDRVYMRFKLVKESFWRAYALWALSFLFVTGFLWMLTYFTKKRTIANQALQASEAERELAVAHLQSLRSQMNPHFIFNALGSIQYYIETKESEIATEYLSDFAMLMRLILESSKNELIPFKNEIKQLELYVRLESMRFEERFDFSFEIDKEIDPDFQMPPMFIQPFIENAINHGLYHLTDRKGRLLIKASHLSDESIQFLIRDNGIGREASKHLRRSQHISRGMQIIKERIKALEHQEIFVQLDILDVVEGGEGKGTEVRVVFTYKD